MSSARMTAPGIGLERRSIGMAPAAMVRVGRAAARLLPSSDLARIALLAGLFSVLAYSWYSLHGETLLFNDARLSEMIGRRVVASLTPGLSELGTTWLPLRFLLMLPLIWNDALFRSGLAGSLPSMVGYVLAAVFAYRIAHLVLGSRVAGWVAALVMLLNPSLLYMQSTAMSELLSMSFFLMSVYYALRLTRSREALDVVKCAAAVMAGTGIRYENWYLAVLMVPVLAIAGWRAKGYVLAEAWTILYALLAFAGCVAWVIYNWVIFGDPLLSFFYGNASHQFYPGETLPSHGDAGLAFLSYSYSVIGVAGVLMVALAVPALVLFLWRMRWHVVNLPAYLLLAPFAFYWLVLYRGVNTLTMPELETGPYYQIRFGMLMLPAVALLLAVLAHSLRRLSGRYHLVVPAVIVVSFLVGTAQTPYVLREALDGPGGAASAEIGSAPDGAKLLASAYHGGTILLSHVDTGENSSAKAVTPQFLFALLVDHGISDKALLTDANGSLFEEALRNPQDHVAWIVMTYDQTGHEAQWPSLRDGAAWRDHFALRWSSPTTEFGTTEIYERIELQPEELRGEVIR